MNPLFSIIIPAHNEENYIRQTLHSIKNQSFQNFETIVVTNGCTDKTDEIVRKKSDIKHFSLPAANVSRARNYGAAQASGKYLLFLDADTSLHQDSLKKIKDSVLDSHSIATTKALPDSSALKFRMLLAMKNFQLKTGIYKGCSGALVCRREDFDKVDGYDSSINVREHRKLILKLSKLGKYKCVDTQVTTSMRRYANWSLGKAAFFWTKQWFKDRSGTLHESDYEKIR